MLGPIDPEQTSSIRLDYLGALMGTVTSIFSAKKTFTLDQANEALPLIIRLTAEAQREISKLSNRREAIQFGSSEAAKGLEEKIQGVVDAWQGKLAKLGAVPKGLWLADFDNGRGYYCWKYPESEIRFWHGYQDGFSGRQEIQLRPSYENSNRPNQPDSW